MVGHADQDAANWAAALPWALRAVDTAFELKQTRCVPTRADLGVGIDHPNPSFMHALNQNVQVVLRERAASYPHYFSHERL